MLLNIRQAKVNLSRLVRCVENGEEVVIARAGRPIVRLVAVELLPAPLHASTPGKRTVWIADDFGPLPDDVVAELFSNDSPES